MKIGAILGLVGLLATAASSQQKDWTPPQIDINKSYLEAAKALLGHGLADPRGGVFSRFDIKLGDATGAPAKYFNAYGWLLPDNKDAVLLDGLEYTGFVSREPANLDDVIGRLDKRKTVFPYRDTIPVYYNNPALPALLLLVGRPDLAAAEYVNSQPTNVTPQGLLNHFRYRYMMQIAQAMIERHDSEALRWANGLAAEAAVHDAFPFPKDIARLFPPPTPELPVAHALVTDLQVRASNKKREPLDFAAIEKLPKAKRIATLVADLDTIGAKQWSQPGGPAYDDDPLVKALTNQGDAAVPALIDAIESDRRFTRVVTYWQDFYPQREIHTVKEAAWDVLRDLWPSVGHVGNAPDGQTTDPELLRQAWVKEEKLTQTQRWLLVLTDEQAKPGFWAAAARALVKANQANRMSGESLGPNLRPEITDLMVKRAEACSLTSFTSSNWLWTLNAGFEIGHYLRRWDPEAAKKCLPEICKRFLSIEPRLFANFGLPMYTGSDFARVIVDRLALGDETAGDDYAAFVKNATFNDAFMARNILSPMWVGQKNPGIQAATDRFMAAWAKDMTSPELQKALETAQFMPFFAADSELIEVPAFRKLLVLGLQNTSIAGYGIANLAQKSIDFGLSGGTKPNGEAFWKMLPPPGERGSLVPVLIADQLASRLASGGLKGVPPFDLLGSDAIRSAQRKAIIEWLEDDHRDWRAVAMSSPFVQTQAID